MQYIQTSKYGAADRLYDFNDSIKAIIQVKHHFNGDKNNKFFSFPLVCGKERDGFIREQLKAGLHMFPSHLTENEIKHYEGLGYLVVKDGQRKLLKLNCERGGCCELVASCEDNLHNAVISYIDSYKENLIKKHQNYLTCIKRLVSAVETLGGIKFYKHLDDYVVGYENGNDFYVYFATSINIVRSLPYVNIYCGIDFGEGLQNIYAVVCDDLRKYCDMCDLYTLVDKPNAFSKCKKLYQEMKPFSCMDMAQLIRGDSFAHTLSLGDGDYSNWLDAFANVSNLNKFYQVIIKDDTLIVFDLQTLSVCFCLSNNPYIRCYNLGLRMTILKPSKQLEGKKKHFFFLSKTTLKLSGQRNKSNRKALNKFERLLSVGEFQYKTFYISSLSKNDYDNLILEYKFVYKEWARAYLQREQSTIINYRYHFLSFSDTLSRDLIYLMNPFIQEVRSVSGVLQGFCVFSKVSKHQWYEISSTFIRDAYPDNLAKVLDFKMLQCFKDDPNFILDIGSSHMDSLSTLKRLSNPSLLGVINYIMV